MISGCGRPPEGGGTRRLFLSGHGLALAPDEPGQRDYLGDAGVGVAAGMWDPFGTGNGWPEEQSGDDARSLTFTSEPLPGPLLIAGRPEAELYLVTGSACEAQLAVRLAMVGPDGRSTLITTGWRAAAAVRGLRRLSPHLAVGGKPGDPRLLRRGPSLGAAHTRMRSRGRAR